MSQSDNSFSLQHMIRTRNLEQYALEFGMSKERFIHWLDQFDHILDGGCGEEVALTEMLFTFGIKKIYGVDLSPAGISGVSRSADFQEVPFVEDLFDAGIFCESFGIYAENEEVFKKQITEIARIHKPKSRILLNLEPLNFKVSEYNHINKEDLYQLDFTLRNLDHSNIFPSKILKLINENSTFKLLSFQPSLTPENLPGKYICCELIKSE